MVFNVVEHDVFDDHDQAKPRKATLTFPVTATISMQSSEVWA